jgi:hypothetical protein
MKLYKSFIENECIIHIFDQYLHYLRTVNFKNKERNIYNSDVFLNRTSIQLTPVSTKAHVSL